MSTALENPSKEEVPKTGKETLFKLLEKHKSRPSVPGMDWARGNWYNLQAVTDRIVALQKDAKVRSGKGKGFICAVLGASLAAAVEEKKQKSYQTDMVIDSLQRVIQTLQEQLKETKEFLEKERKQNIILKDELREQLLRKTDTLAKAEVKLLEKGIRQIRPQGDLQKAKETVKSPPPYVSAG